MRLSRLSPSSAEVEKWEGGGGKAQSHLGLGVVVCCLHFAPDPGGGGWSQTTWRMVAGNG
jgi:hypothetical protein